MTIEQLQKLILRNDIVISKKRNMYYANVKNGDNFLIAKKRSVNDLYNELKYHNIVKVKSIF